MVAFEHDQIVVRIRISGIRGILALVFRTLEQLEAVYVAMRMRLLLEPFKKRLQVYFTEQETATICDNACGDKPVHFKYQSRLIDSVRALYGIQFL